MSSSLECAPFFDPPLAYDRANGSDVDFEALFKPGRTHKREAAPNVDLTANMDGTVNRPSHVVISDYKAHNALDVCASQSARGPSFVSIQDGTYCDMSTKTYYPICSNETVAG